MKLIDSNTMEDVREFLKSMYKIHLNLNPQSYLIPCIKKLLSEDLASRVIWIVEEDFAWMCNPKVDSMELFEELPFGTRIFIVEVKGLNIVEVNGWREAEKAYAVERAKEELYEKTQKECIKMLIDEMLEEGK